MTLTLQLEVKFLPFGCKYILHECQLVGSLNFWLCKDFIKLDEVYFQVKENSQFGLDLSEQFYRPAKGGTKWLMF